MQCVSAIKIALLSTALFAAACSRFQQQPAAIERLKPCTYAQGPTDAYCGTVEVWEDRAARSGRKIALKVIVLPGLKRDAAPDPLFFLAGGPGQGAAKIVKAVREIFRSIQIDRDIVLVDQRGTGDSNPLTCKPADDEKFDERPEAAIEKMRTCMTEQQKKADLRLYTTTIAMDD